MPEPNTRETKIVAVALGDCDWLKTRTLLLPVVDGDHGFTLHPDFNPLPCDWVSDMCWLQALEQPHFDHLDHVTEAMHARLREALGAHAWLIGGPARPYMQQEAPQVVDTSNLGGRSGAARPGRLFVALDFVTDRKTHDWLCAFLVNRASMPLELGDPNSHLVMRCKWAWSRLARGEEAGPAED